MQRKSGAICIKVLLFFGIFQQYIVALELSPFLQHTDICQNIIHHTLWDISLPVAGASYYNFRQANKTFYQLVNERFTHEQENLFLYYCGDLYYSVQEFARYFNIKSLSKAGCKAYTLLKSKYDQANEELYIEPLIYEYIA